MKYAIASPCKFNPQCSKDSQFDKMYIISLCLSRPDIVFDCCLFFSFFFFFFLGGGVFFFFFSLRC